MNPSEDRRANAGRILYRNVYGWFEPAGRDRYRLTEQGAHALAEMRWHER